MAKPHPALIDIAADRSAASVVDPDALLRSADEHCMSSLLWSRVCAGEIEVPRDLGLILASRATLTRNRNLEMERTLGAVVTRLEERGITVATFKGVTAERRWYDRVGDRPCRDVDLLLAPKDLDRVDEVVDALEPTYPFRTGLRRRIEEGIQQGWTLSFDGVGIDVHAELPKLGVPSRTTELVWGRTVPFQLASGRTVLVLDPEAQLFSFLTHLIKDRIPVLLGFVDVARIVDRSELDWDAVADLARADGLEVPLRMTLDAVLAQLGLPGPRGRRRMRRGAAPAWRVLCRPGVMFQGRTMYEHRPRRLLLMPLVISGRRWEVTRWLLRRAFPPAHVVPALYGDRPGGFVTRLRLVPARVVGAVRAAVTSR